MMNLSLLIIVCAIFNFSVNVYYTVTMMNTHAGLYSDKDLTQRQAVAILKSVMPSYFYGLQITSLLINVLTIVYVSMSNIKCKPDMILALGTMSMVNLGNILFYNYDILQLDVTTTYILLCVVGSLFSLYMLVVGSLMVIKK
jgi:hypothetical protein